MAGEAIALRTTALHAHYGPSHVLHGVDLDVPTGETVGLVGRNGVGKTTLVHTVVGMVSATGGAVEVFGEEVTRQETHCIAARGVQLVPQGRRLFPSLTVHEHLQLASRGGTGRYTPEWVYETFPALGERAASLGQNLSGGEQSLLAISRAIMHDPQLILMDEPTEGLAPLMVAEVGRLVRLLQEDGVSILLVEQNLDFALSVCGRVAVMSRGQVVHVENTVPGQDRDAFIDRFMGVQFQE
ncbi:MAG: hypothetical protein Kow00129_05910 [Thermoleophilia bacterium]